MKSSLRPAVFLDRDGVINAMIMVAGKWRAPLLLEDFEYFDGVPEAILLLRKAGFLTVVVTNQPDVSRGWQRQEVVEAMNRKVKTDLGVDSIQVCYHDYRHQCECRKPKPGMLETAARELGIDLTASYLVGDRFGDILAGHAVGCISILVGPGDAETLSSPPPSPDARVNSLREAADWILRHTA